MRNEVKLWLAGELEGVLTTAGNFMFSVNNHWHTCRFYADTPDAAYIREKVVGWLELDHNVTIRGFEAETDEGQEWWFETIIGGYKYESDDVETRTQAIVAAVEWLYERREA